MKEIWKVIPEFPTHKASNKGRIRSPRRILKPCKDGRGYLLVHIFPSDQTKRVHRLVASAFLGPSALHVNHKDLNPSNNNINNLEYCSYRENIDHAKKHGVMKYAAIKRTVTNILRGHFMPLEKVKKIRKYYKNNKISIHGLGRIFSISYPQAWNIINYKTWKNI